MVDILFIDSCSEQKFCGLVGEHVAVVVDDVIFFRLEARADVFQEILEDVLRKLGFPQRYFRKWLAVWRLLWQIIADSTAKIVLPSIDYDGGMVDCIDLLPNNHHAHGASHAHGDVVDE